MLQQLLGIKEKSNMLTQEEQEMREKLFYKWKLFAKLFQEQYWEESSEGLFFSLAYGTEEKLKIYTDNDGKTLRLIYINPVGDTKTLLKISFYKKTIEHLYVKISDHIEKWCGGYPPSYR